MRVALATLAAVTVLATAQAAAAQTLVQPEGNGGCLGQDESGACGPYEFGAVLALAPRVHVGYLALDQGIYAFPYGADGSVGRARCAIAHCSIGGDASYVSLTFSADGRFAYTLDAFEKLQAYRVRPDGALAAVPGRRGCISSERRRTCQPWLGEAVDVRFALAPDGRYLYALVPTTHGARMRVFARLRNGGLRPASGPGTCFDAAPRPRHGCRHARGLGYGEGPPLVSSDGRNLYVLGENAVLTFARERSGRLRQLPAAAGCIGESDVGQHCARTDSWPVNADALTLTHDGRELLVSVSDEAATVMFRRDRRSGRLGTWRGRAGRVRMAAPVETGGDFYAAQDGNAVAHFTLGRTGFVREACSGLRSACAKADVLNPTQAVAVSPDGNVVFAVSQLLDAAVALKRNADGSLAVPAGVHCVGVPPGGGCDRGVLLAGADTLAIAPDGADLYLGTYNGITAVDLRSGGLAERPQPAVCGVPGPGCRPGASEAPVQVVASPDGMQIYQVGYAGIDTYRRDPLTGELEHLPGEAGCMSAASGCAQPPFVRPRALALSPDGRFAFVAADNGVFTLTRDSSGVLSAQTGSSSCIAQAGAGGCASGHALDRPRTLVVAPDGRHVYAGVQLPAPDVGPAAVAVLEADPATGALTQRDGAAGCMAEAGEQGCAATPRLPTASLALSADGRFLYASATDRPPAVIALDAADGRPVEIAHCALADAVAATCRPGTVLPTPAGDSAYSLAKQPDRGPVVFLLRRDPATGLVERTSSCLAGLGGDGEVRVPGCVPAAGLRSTAVQVMRPDGTALYAAGTGDGADNGGAVTQFLLR